MASTTTTTTTTLLRCLFVATLLLSSLPVPSTAQVKGCPVTSIYMHLWRRRLLHVRRFNHVRPPRRGFPHTTFQTTVGATVMSTAFFVERDIQFPRHPLMQSLETQIQNFFATKEEDLHRALLFLDQFGANDYKLAFLQGKSTNEVSRYVPKVVDGIKKIMKKLINAGAAHLLVTGVSPMGCLPGYLTLLRNKDRMQYDPNNCLRELDAFARLHNDHLRQALMELSLEYPRVQIVYGDYYKAFVALLRNRALLGFGKGTLTKACCVFGDPYNFRPKETCRNGGVDVLCSNPAEYVHWDGFHLTQEASKHVVEAFVAGRGFMYPEFKFPEVMHCTMK